jgi:acetyltransferase-like isoleucine patch superfamily enzyme
VSVTGDERPGGAADWHAGAIPANVVLADTAFVETTHCLSLYRSIAPVGLRIGRGTCVYAGTMFDVGQQGRIAIGDCGLLNDVRFICESAITIGHYAFIAWNVVLMDCYRSPHDPRTRCRQLQALPFGNPRRLNVDAPARPIRIEDNVWIGFNSCILPGVTIGEGSVVGARSVVVDDVPPYTLVGGNPARPVRGLERPEEEVLAAAAALLQDR